MKQLLRHRSRLGHQPQRQTGRPAVERLETRLAPANVNVTTYHYDNFLSGWNNQETALTTAKVSNRDLFGQLFSQPVDGYVYATPLYKKEVPIGAGALNVGFVATEHDSVYAFDTDTGNQLWKRSFISIEDGITTVPQQNVISPDIVPEIGITGTPVIAGNILYVVAKTKETRKDGNHYVLKLHAISITDGTDALGPRSEVLIGDIQADNPTNPAMDDPTKITTDVTWQGNGAGSLNGTILFNALREHQRPALTLLNGFVYVGFASHGDNGPYHGWIVGYDETDLALGYIFNTTANARAGGIWQSGGGLASDGTSLFFATGNAFGNNGFDPAAGNWGESVLKLTPGKDSNLSVADYFTPNNWRALDGADLDLGSGGTMLLPDSVGSTAHPHLLVETGKTGRVYLIDRDNMGHNVPVGMPDQVVQVFEIGGPGVWGNPSFYLADPGQPGVRPAVGYILYHGSESDLAVLRISNGQITGFQTRSRVNFGFPGGQPIVSSNDQSNPIVWDVQVDSFRGPGAANLHAYDLTTGTPTTELYNSNAVGLRDQAGGSVKFIAATQTNGKVLVGGVNSFSIYGMFPDHASAPAVRTNLEGASPEGGTPVTLTWTNSDNLANQISIERGTNVAGPFTQLAIVNRLRISFTDTTVTPDTQYFYRIRATNERGSSAFTDPAPVHTRIAKSNLTVAHHSSLEVSLSWTRTGNDGYQIERSFNGADFEPIGPRLPSTQTTFVDTAIPNDPRGIYYYLVEAFNTGPDDFSGSNIVSASNIREAFVSDHSDDVGGFTEHTDFQANGDARFLGTAASLTSGLGQTSSFFSTERGSITTFDVDFRIRFHDGSARPADGMCFVLQGNSSGSIALGGGGGGLGYGVDEPNRPTDDRGIRNSICVKFDIWDNAGETDNSTGLFTDGRSPTVRRNGLPPDIPDIALPLGLSTTDPTVVNLRNANRKEVHLSYDGRTLREVLTDMVTGARFTHDYTVDIPRFIGSDTAFVGFTGATGGAFTNMDIEAFKFVGGIQPVTPDMLRVTDVTGANVTLAWRSNSTNEDGFLVEHSRDNVHFSEVARVNEVGAQSLQFTEPTPNFYYYRVRAFNADAVSGPSNSVSASVGDPGVSVDHSVDVHGFEDHSDLRTNATRNGGAIAFPGFIQSGESTLARLTDDRDGLAVSLFRMQRVPVSSTFTTSFVVQVDPRAIGGADGLAFVLQNDPRGAAALGNSGGDLGYGGGDNQRIIRSVAVEFNIWDGNSHNPHHTLTKLFTNGNTDRTGEIDMTDRNGVNFLTHHPCKVDLSYDGGTLFETVRDLTTGQTFSTSYAVDIRGVLGSNQAWVGFTGGTGGATAIDDILNWTADFKTFAALPNFVVAGFPNPATAGDVNTFTVTVKDGAGNIINNYSGTVSFTSSDPNAILPRPYTFNPATDHGVHTFGAVLRTVGTQTIVATDDTSFDPESITEQQTVTVVAPSAPVGGGQTGKPSVITVTPAPSDTQLVVNTTSPAQSSDARNAQPAAMADSISELRMTGSQSTAAVDHVIGSLGDQGPNGSVVDDLVQARIY